MFISPHTMSFESAL